ncbi:MAG TPA: hypothetical protein VF599_11770 [Pyrinomonadaceae bacterium]
MKRLFPIPCVAPPVTSEPKQIFLRTLTKSSPKPNASRRGISAAETFGEGRQFEYRARAAASHLNIAKTRFALPSRLRK